ncbi:MAG: diaminopimelate decarboxylase [Bdellovibrionales bacterium]|nr:diaminopimelate decarboxylase [Bdellovibrionales bacterium]
MPKPLEYFTYRDGILSAEEVALTELAEKFGTPTYVYSKEAFLAPLRDLERGLAGLDHLVCFAVKANSNLSVLKLLAEAGAGMDLVSGGELRRALRAGADPGKLVFSGVGKSLAEIDEGLAHPLHSFNVESVVELKLLSDRAKAAGKRARVALRFNPDVDPKTHPYISTGLKKNKFGLQRAEILALLKRHEFAGVRIAGLSIHIGSQILSLSPFEDAFKKTKRMVGEIESILGSPLEFLDLGGGLGIPYRNEKPPSIEAYTKLIRKHFGPKSEIDGRYRILLEPGRTIAGNSGVLLSRVLYRKPRKTKDFVIVDAGMNDLVRPALYGSYHEIVPVEAARGKGKRRKCDVVGPVCESSDCFASDRPLADRIEGGDLVAFLSAGAYGMSMASQYNTRGRPAEVLVDGEGYRLIRKRETFEDLIGSEVFR